MKYEKLTILGEEVPLDKKAFCSLLCLLSEQHGRICQRIGKACDMDESTVLAGLLCSLNQAYKSSEKIYMDLEGS